MAAKNNSNEIKIIRIFDAPVATVWEAWTDPEQVGQWWGPRLYPDPSQQGSAPRRPLALHHARARRH